TSSTPRSKPEYPILHRELHELSHAYFLAKNTSITPPRHQENPAPSPPSHVLRHEPLPDPYPAPFPLQGRSFRDIKKQAFQTVPQSLKAHGWATLSPPNRHEL